MHECMMNLTALYQKIGMRIFREIKKQKTKLEFKYFEIQLFYVTANVLQVPEMFNFQLIFSRGLKLLSENQIRGHTDGQT